MLSVLVNDRNLGGAMEVFERMEERNTSSWNYVLMGCMKEGLKDEAFSLFHRMLGICANIPSVDMGKQLHACIPDASTWGALLGACRIHGDVNVARLAASKLLELDPKNAAHYILMYNVYEAAGRWVEAEEINEMMRKGKKSDLPRK
ncbi:unnamed protein product [Spirodela intermedia]|uniref:Uncharacterized protein n=1 Tax=Spirodela intermedia TaxID=51605 RepID=A0A7I8J3W9_SPIIN|nr:unnamed protein product [Spirodela intermedia]CAA6664780.1 unnamed protein product [Spirodela intermedia]